MKTKTTLIASILFAASAVMSMAASYTIQTGALATSNGFANSAGVAFQNSASASFAGPGIVGFGVFSISDSAISAATSATQLVSTFTGYGASPTGTFTAAGLSANRGTFSRNSVAGTTTSQFNDSFIYLFVGNAASYAASTEFAVLKTSFKFLASEDSVPTPIVYTVTNLNSSILFGTALADVKTTGTDNSVTPGFGTAGFGVIPEPSAAFLGAIGALGLLRRRRN